MIVIFLTSCGQAGPPKTKSSPSGVSPTLVDSPTTLPTSTPYLNHLDPSAILFEQDFEAGNTTRLSNTRENWTIVIDDSGNHFFCNNMVNHLLAFPIGLNQWTDYAIELRIKELEHSEDPYVAVYARVSPPYESGYYGALNFQDHITDLALDGPYISLEQQYFPTTADTWYTLRLEVAGEQIKYYINDLLVGHGTDDHLSQGRAGFFVSPFLKVCVDDIRARALTKTGAVGQAPPLVSSSLEMVIDNISVGQAGNSWGGHQSRIVRTQDGVFSAYIVEGNGEFDREWRLVWRQEDGTWPVIAQGHADGPVHLLASPDGTLHVIGWPNETGTMWSGKPNGNKVNMTKEVIPGVAHSYWHYSSAGIDAQGNLCILSTQGASPGIFQWACFLPEENRWVSQNTTTDYGFRYTYVFPNPEGGLSLVSTRDVLWEVLGYKQPPDVSDYVFNAIGYWKTDDIKNDPLRRTFFIEEKPTDQFPFVFLNAQKDAYLDTVGNMHILYVREGESTYGARVSRHAIISPGGEILNDVKLPDELGDYFRIFQDKQGVFYILGSSGLLYPAGDDGVTLGTPMEIDLQGYTVEYSGYGISVPRTGTPISNVLDVVFPSDGGTKWIYFQIPLPIE